MALPPRAGMSESLQIFQDSFFNQSSPMISHAPMPSGGNPIQRRLSQANGANALHSNSNGANVVINPPIQPAASQSPLKSASTQPTASPLSPVRSVQPGKLNAVSFKPPVDTSKPTDSIQKKQPLMSRFKTVAKKPCGDGAAAYSGKENSHPVIFPAPPGFSLSIESYYQKAPPGKRLLEPAPIKDSRPFKKQRAEDGPLPPHDSFPPIVDDGHKPGHSYATLIGMAILRSPARKLTLSQIYKWISDTYAFYSPQDAGWQNSIRHNLSLNKAFVKQERPKDDPGKGNYWAIEAGMEATFMKDKIVRKLSAPGDNLQVMSTSVLEPSLPPMPASFQEPALPQLPPMPLSMMEPLSMPAANAPRAVKQQEPSSDATIIASDTTSPDEQSALPHNKSASQDRTDATSFDSSLCSPIPNPALHSSPPISRHIEADRGTPPRMSLGSSTNRSRKRKSASVDDSGYISSLESSAIRSNQNIRHVPSEGIDRSRIKRGRAEEEIARLRASSYDSPTKSRSRNSYAAPSSSPLRPGQGDGSAGHMMPPPLTPAVKFTAPPRPPPSVSPGTNLRMHRDKVRHMLASPLRRITSATEEIQQSFDFDESLYNFTDEAEFPLDTNTLGSGFEIYQDDSLPNLFPSIHNGSPVKAPSHRRQRPDRSQSVSALSEVTNSAVRRSITSAPYLKVPSQSPLDTPSKFFDNLPSSPSKFFNQSPTKMPSTALAGSALDQAFGGDENSNFPLDDFCTPDFIQDVDDFGGLDILQGFQKIGSHPQPLFSAPAIQQPQLVPYQQQQQQRPFQQSRTSKNAQKPALGRSFSTAF